MRSSLVHELPGRLRIELSVPRSPAPDPSYVESSLSILGKGASAAVNRRLNAEVLDATAVGVAMGVGDHGTAGTISFLLKLGGYLEEWTKQRSSRNLAEMFCRGEGWAWIRRDGREARVEVKD